MSRWFGTSWGAPVNHPDYEVPIPLGELCDYCAKPFDSDSQGHVLPHTTNSDEVERFHRLCLNILIVGPEVAAFIERTRSGGSVQDQQEAANPSQEGATSRQQGAEQGGSCSA